MEITNNFRKMIASLGSAKGRRTEGCFIAEGTKCVVDTWQHFKCRYLIATPQWIQDNGQNFDSAEIIAAKRSDMERMSQLSTPSNVIAVYEIPEWELDETTISDNLILALDRVQDPGNLGTIIRVADWFGVNDIVCSNDTVDVYNPKVVQATMGAISRVRIHYIDLPEFLKRHRNMPIYGTSLDGENIYKTRLHSQGIVIMGNEGQGLSVDVRKLVSRNLFIPSFPPDCPTSESLNVGTATAIVLSEFRRPNNQ